MFEFPPAINDINAHKLSEAFGIDNNRFDEYAGLMMASMGLAKAVSVRDPNSKSRSRSAVVLRFYEGSADYQTYLDSAGGSRGVIRQLDPLVSMPGQLNPDQISMEIEKHEASLERLARNCGDTALQQGLEWVTMCADNFNLKTAKATR